MNHDLLNILSDDQEEVDNQKLLDYVSGQLSEADAHEVEKLMAKNELINDAVEGLQQVKGKKNIESLVEQLQKDLHRKLEQKKVSRNKKRILEHPWIYMAIILILLLVVCAWFVLQRLHHVK